MVKNSSNSFNTLVEPGDEHFKRRPSRTRALSIVSLQNEKVLSIPTIDDPLGQREIKNSTTDCETLLHIFKGNVGSGYLALPMAVMNAGLWVGLIGVPILGSTCTHCMNLILHSSQELCRRTGTTALNYEETAEMSFRSGPERVRKWANTFFNVVTCFLVLTQLGFCCVYMVFISQNMYQAVECISGGTNITQFDYLVITLVPVLLICYIPNLKYLAPVSMIANILQVIGLVITFYYLMRDLPDTGPNVAGHGTLREFPLFFGTALYAFEGIGLVLPLENNMKKPTHLSGWTGVLNTGMLVTVCLYTAIGFFGYLTYGDKILGSVTLNLPGSEIPAQMVKILMATAIFLTYPLQFYVPLIILLPFFVNRVKSTVAKIVVEYAFRSFLVFFTFILAAVIPNVALFTNLVGAVCSASLALIFPPLIDIITYWPEKGKYNIKLIKNCIIIFVGILGFITGSYMSIVEIIKFFESGETELETGC